MGVELFFNNYITALAAAITSTGANNITVVSGSPIAAVGASGFQTRIAIDSELMLVTAVAGNTLTVTRGIEGTTAATHANGAMVYGVLTAGSVAYALPLTGGVITTTTGPFTVGVSAPTVEFCDNGFAQIIVNGGSSYNYDVATIDVGPNAYGAAAAFSGEVDIGNGGFTDPSPGMAYDLKCGGPNGGLTTGGSVNANNGFLAGNILVINGSGQIFDNSGDLILDTDGTLSVPGNLGFYGKGPIGQPNVTGSRASGAALVSLLTALSNLGLVSNSTTT